MRVALAAMSVVAAGAFGGMGVASAEPAVPDAGQLTSELRQVLNTGAPASERAAKLAGGQSAVPTADNIANRLNSYGGMVNWQVQNPVPNGDRLDAQLAVTIPIFGTKTHDIYWVDQDGAWKLSNPSACVIATDVAGVDCTV
ncbi:MULTISPECIES: hypothetical protein [Mycolicibacterium]|uniref:Low molecular weight antigen MTB12-like C-terminal domain-containing protein n=1 Tax=Mycolicibacterium vanbaalenii (strain DSM 7251 / JCM 13017 / BCRC 16820 / KCTC 9966 / NRRL B-24157 / PYR-1) TaxID=350058 RepID=A1T5K8_MYCVP|nr:MULTISPECIES: hypothetical protein [Mycolicibacterium]ABM12458.1 conserved hypothetical protein [Mycolicibacterium vanbaalenii PYR-1]MCV7127120.1 hypothetical protein [Mycolicibacterium vanbaalenii PYR-1]MDW5611039.1 hypothetical protein [Mycolicibacterium sp. D5.8-2]QZY47701.1 hypothetical protein K5L12_08315 [Mycolicibacterium austroafricanum]UJL31435.1 hypothetical protein HZU38_14075 [Mycolicibacterium vanbaalenii]